MKVLVPALILISTAAFAPAATIFDFTDGLNITSPPSPLGTASTVYNGAASSLGTTTLNLGPGVTLTGSSTLTCVAGTTPTGCFSGTVTTSNTAGLGILGGGSDARIDAGETFTITVNPGYTASLVDFSLAGFSGAETFDYNLGAGAVSVTPNGNVGTDTYTINSSNFTTLTFTPGSGSNANLSSLTLNITAVATPEPATFGMLGLALVGLGTFRRFSKR